MHFTHEGEKFCQEMTHDLEGSHDAAQRGAGAAVAVLGRRRVNVDSFFSLLVLGSLPYFTRSNAMSFVAMFRRERACSPR